MTKPRTHLTNYLVVPLQGDPGERTVRCQYFREDFSTVPPTWIVVDPSKLSTHHHDMIYVRQPTAQEAAPYVPKQDTTLELFAAVAKTHDADCGMPNLMSASERRLSVSVFPQTTRSLILVFQRFEADGKFGELVATTDPDVQHGTDGTPLPDC
jgi:hypothetical protein